MSHSKLIYVAGSMAQRDAILRVSASLRAAGYDVFNDWLAPGEDCDVKWREFCQAQGMSYIEALYAPHAQHVFAFDKTHLDLSDAFVLVYPAGKSAHAELGYMAGQKKPAYVLIDVEPERWDVMLGFATRVVATVDDLLARLQIAVPV